MRMLSRDPFAREELFEETIRVSKEYTTVGKCLCAWCGSPGKEHKTFWSLKRFYTEPDSLYQRRNKVAKGMLFCSVGCMRAYTDTEK